MLKLQKLELRGFKSFCDFTEVTFNEAITGVVGPNGCGKSNIVDAMAWVLGEQSARLLRGSRMEDVIFQGSSSRPAVNLAEVSLSFRALADVGIDGDGAEEPAPEDEGPEADRPSYSKGLELRIKAGDTVAVSRRLYRSGESEYLINGKQVRLRDVRDLFAGTGLGPGHYAIIGQGHVTEIVTAKPYERRTMIEEAAGISKFRLRQHAIELRLESTRQNLNRLEDLFSELDRQISSLKRQAAKARRYGRLKEEQRSLLRILYVEEHRSARAGLEQVETRLAEVGRQRGEYQTTIGKLEVALRACEEASRGHEAEVSAARDRLATSELESEKQNARRLQTEEQINSLNTRRGDLEREVAFLNERTGLVQQERERAGASLEALRLEVDREQQTLGELEGQLGAAAGLIREMEAGLESLRASLLTQINKLSEWRNRWSQIEDHERRWQADATRLEAEGERTTARAAQLLSESESLSREVAVQSDALVSGRSELEQLAGRLIEERAQRDALLSLRAERERECIAAEERLASLMDLEQRRAGYTQAVQALFETFRHQHGPSFKLLGTLTDFTHVEAEHEKLLESFLGERLQALVVPTLDDAAQATRLLEAEGAGRATFLVAGIQGGQGVGASGVRGWAGANNDAGGSRDLTGLRLIELLHLPDHLSLAFSEAFPEMAGAKLARDLVSAIEGSSVEPDSVFVTPQGDWTRAGRVLVGGGQENSSSGLLAVKREMAELSQRTESLRSMLTQVTRDEEQAVGRVHTLEGEVTSTDDEVRAIEKRLMQDENRLSEIERDRDRAAQQLKVIEFETSQAEKDREELARRKSSVGEELRGAEDDLKALESAHRDHQAGLAAQREHHERLSQSISEVRSAHSARLERLGSLDREGARLEREAHETHVRMRQCESETGRLRGEVELAAATLTGIELRSDQIAADRVEKAGEVHDAESRLREIHAQLDEIRARLDATRGQEDVVRDEQGGLEVQRAELSAALRYLAEDCWKELSQPLEDLAKEGIRPTEGSLADEPAPSPDVPSLKASIEEIRRKVEELGPVNMMAVEELQELEQRAEFLQSQRQDILDSMVSTEQALEEIKRRSRERFREAFAHINLNFQGTFQELFGGGHGEMHLLDPENILESGIDIVAQPPGKRLQNILLLSGGEKSMTAIALLLAIFRYRPSPFCVLDEVDAQLDDMNVGRFSQKVAEMSQATQFIVITHNKDTMEAAQVLHGVTMEEPGVSKLLSVRLR